jgi:tellurite resistance protein TerC
LLPLALTEPSSFVELDVTAWAWVFALGAIVLLLLFDLLVLHRKPTVPVLRRAVIESIGWILVGTTFGVIVLVAFGSTAGGEWFSGYLIEYSLSVDNVFVWALILGYFAVPPRYQHRVLFWGVFGALVLRALFIFAGIALIERFDFMLFIFGAFLIYTAVKLAVTDDDEADPGDNVFLKFLRKVVPTTDELDGQKLFTRVDARRVATPLFLVLMLVEITDVMFAVDSVPAVLAVSHEQFIVFTSNAFAIMGLRSLYFLLADLRARFTHLQQGLAIILAFVGVKMILGARGWYHIPTPVSLLVIFLVLLGSVAFSLHHTRRTETISVGEEMPPPDER